MNRYPLWKNLLILGVVLLGLLLAMPNLFSQDPSIEITAARGAEVTETSVDEVRAVLDNAGVPYKDVELSEDGRLLARFALSGEQLAGQEAIERTLAEQYRTALTLSADLPGWMRALGLNPMSLGLDLRGGIHVVIDVDMESALDQALERYVGDIRAQLREHKVRYLTVLRDGGEILVKFKDEEARAAADKLLGREFRALALSSAEQGGTYLIRAVLQPAEQEQIKDFALKQNITTLRNRVNALGVAEPSIARQGERRIVVQLPGAQDPGRLKEILGATATLEYRLVDTEHSVADAVSGRVPVGSRLYRDRDGVPILLKRRVIVTGDQITDASAGFDGQSGSPAVFVNLDGQGARRMRDVTTENVGKPMAVVFIENRTTTEMVDGEPVKRTHKVEEVISVATIREPFGRRFQTTGLDSSEEAHNTALLLRSGALAAPIQIVEERTIGPSLGQDNIDQGFRSVMIGLGLVALFMALYYRVFGLVADLVLVVNLVMIVAVLSLLQATLTLPGIAGIVLTVGMAVDANVLIFERIREEIRNGSTPQASIRAGYDKALSTIVDANVTTLIAAVVLFSFGTGPVKGFAVTLFIGIVTSMFTAILGSRAMINLIYGRRNVKKLAI
ncbi:MULTISPECIES: protein translocase subunit SecD [Marichromatium]|uniref:Protein translocase subunit SecD n=1 Tax=Marichromatium gracile TaxID=1048 RepID=A0A4R4AGC4_MARGR|nr:MULTISPECIES: protein translocase subunit SecD [Marichromatium]MBK1708237.1 protein translocase subunit SecD [Marichromatium gracile]RNE90755.1 protein translocase subunit SecD [Marichromatium sp. AB31]TCW38302.1 preprotein translocase subunit SecD [Marichromatium gracile]